MKKRSNVVEAIYPGKMTDVSIGVDQGYEHCGVAVVNGVGKILYAVTLDFAGSMEKKERRLCLVDILLSLQKDYHPVLVVVEHAREFSTGRDGQQFHNKYVIAALKAFTTTIVNALSTPVVSVDTRSAKATACGSATISKEQTASMMGQVYGRKIDEHSADAAVFAMCCFYPNVKLWREE